MSSALEHFIQSYEEYPLSNRINRSTKNKAIKKDIRGREINWKEGINAFDAETGFTPLMLTAIQGNRDLMLALIDRGADIDLRDDKGRSALHLSARAGQLATLVELLKRDALINQTDEHRTTPLMYAANGGYLDCVKALIARGAGVNMIDENGNTSLHFAARNGHHLVVKALIEGLSAVDTRDNNEGFAPLHLAAQYGRKETVVCLLDYVAKVNRRSTKEKITPLMLASREGNKSIVSILINRGADANLIDIHGWTALHYASSWGRKETSNILIVDGHANLNARDQSRDGIGGTTPLIVAAKGGQIDVMKVLLHYGADINLHELKDGHAPIAAAAELGLPDVIKCLLDYNANVNMQNCFTQTTALMMACKHGHIGATIVLLDHFADINILDRKQITALEYARRSNTLPTLYSAIIQLSPLAKVNLIPWLEVEIPLHISLAIGFKGPSDYVYQLLYGKKGIFQGLYLLTADCDVYLLYSLIALLVMCKKCIWRASTPSSTLWIGSPRDSSASFPSPHYSLSLNTPHIAQPFSAQSISFQQIIQDIEQMITKALQTYHISQSHEAFLDFFSLLNYPTKQILLDYKQTNQLIPSPDKPTYIPNKNWSWDSGKCTEEDLYHQIFLRNLYFGPMALTLEYHLPILLTNSLIQWKIDQCFYSCSKINRGVIVDGYGYYSNFLLTRYFPIVMFCLEGVGHLIYGLLLIYYFLCTKDYTTSSLYSSNSLVNGKYVSISSLQFVDIAVIVGIVAFNLYELGLIEEKRWMITTSVVFDYKALEQLRFKAIYHHFLDNIYKVCDLCVCLIGLIWLGNKISYLVTSTDINQWDLLNKFLLCSILPLGIGLTRYFSLFLPEMAIDLLILSFFLFDIFIFVVIVVIVAICFGILLYLFNLRQENMTNNFHTLLSTALTMFYNTLAYYEINEMFVIPSQSSSSFYLFESLLLILFLLFIQLFLGNILLSKLISKYSVYSQQATVEYYRIKCEWLKQHSIILEKSPLCMLPLPLNLLSSSMYIPHVYANWKNKFRYMNPFREKIPFHQWDEIPERERRRLLGISWAGTASDLILAMLMFLPCLLYEFVKIHLIIPWNELGFIHVLSRCLLFPVSGGYIALCFIWKMYKDLPVYVILRSRLSEGRLRLFESWNRFSWEDSTITWFDDERLYPACHAFAFGFGSDGILQEKKKKNNLKKNLKKTSRGRAKIHSDSKSHTPQDSEDETNEAEEEEEDMEESEDKETVSRSQGAKEDETESGEYDNNQLQPYDGDSMSKLTHESISLWSNIHSQVTKYFVKKQRTKDVVGKRIRIAQTNPYIQLAKIHQVKDVSRGVNTMKNFANTPMKSSQTSANDGPSVYLLDNQYVESTHSLQLDSMTIDNQSSSFHPNDDHVPEVLWIGDRDINPYQPGIMDASEWNKLATEKEEINPPNKTKFPTINIEQQQLLLNQKSSLYFHLQQFSMLFTEEEKRNIFKHALLHLESSDFANEIRVQRDQFTVLNTRITQLEAMIQQQSNMIQQFLTVSYQNNNNYYAQSYAQQPPQSSQQPQQPAYNPYLDSSFA